MNPLQPRLRRACRVSGVRPASAGCRGFTLIELVTVLVIMGAIGAMTLPGLFDNNTFEQRGYIEELASSLRYAQKIAMASGCAVQVNIGVGGHSAQQRAALNTCNAPGPFALQVMRSDGSAVLSVAPVGVVTNPATTITFDANGAVPAPAPPQLTVGAFTLDVSPATGVAVVGILP